MIEEPQQPQLFPEAPQPTPEPVDVDAIAAQIGQIADTDPAYRQRSFAARHREADRMGLITDEDVMTTAQKAERELAKSLHPAGRVVMRAAAPALPAEYLAVRRQLPKTTEDAKERRQKELVRGLEPIILFKRKK